MKFKVSNIKKLLRQGSWLNVVSSIKAILSKISKQVFESRSACKIQNEEGRSDGRLHAIVLNRRQVVVMQYPGLDQAVVWGESLHKETEIQQLENLLKKFFLKPCE